MLEFSASHPMALARARVSPAFGLCAHGPKGTDQRALPCQGCATDAAAGRKGAVLPVRLVLLDDVYRLEVTCPCGERATLDVLLPYGACETCGGISTRTPALRCR